MTVSDTVSMDELASGFMEVMDWPLRVGEMRGVAQGTSKEQSDQGGLGPGGVFSVSNTVGQTSTFNLSRIAYCWGKLQALVTNPGLRHKLEWIWIIPAKEFYQALQRLSTDKSNQRHTSGDSGS